MEHSRILERIGMAEAEATTIPPGFVNSIKGKDPGFVDTAKEDYHLKIGSSAIDAANDSVNPLPDKEYVHPRSFRERRVTGLRPDLGAYEYQPQGGQNRPPVLAYIGDKSVDENTFLGFTISATDDGDKLTYSASKLPSGASFNPSTQLFSWTPDYNVVTRANPKVSFNNVHFEVSDGKGGGDLEEITITVNNVNRVPQANDQNVSTNEDTAKAITLTAQDADGDSLTYIIVDSG
jgi:hypothetical protein